MVKIQSDLQVCVHDTVVPEASCCHARSYKPRGIFEDRCHSASKCLSSTAFWYKTSVWHVSQFPKKQSFHQPPISPETAYRKTWRGYCWSSLILGDNRPDKVSTAARLTNVGGKTFFSPSNLAVTVCTTRFNIHKCYVLPTQCIYVFCVDLRTNSYYFPIQH
jgi:hypothetical protein